MLYGQGVGQAMNGMKWPGQDDSESEMGVVRNGKPWVSQSSLYLEDSVRLACFLFLTLLHPLLTGYHQKNPPG